MGNRDQENMSNREDDMHFRNVAKALDIPIEDVTLSQRANAKAVCFGAGSEEDALKQLKLFLRIGGEMCAPTRMRTPLCDLGVGCDEYGACYADAHGRPEMCGRPSTCTAAEATAPSPYAFQHSAPGRGGLYIWGGWPRWCPCEIGDHLHVWHAQRTAIGGYEYALDEQGKRTLTLIDHDARPNLMEYVRSPHAFEGQGGTDG